MNETPSSAAPLPIPGTDDIWCVIPVFNNKDTVRQVASDCRTHLRHVVVADDGSTDADVASLFAGTDITVLRHARNLGKGRAILTALEHVRSQGGQFIITLDADGQHRPADIPRFIPLIRENPDGIIIGCRDFSVPNVPRSSRFGRSFSNFWVKLETGISTGDSQSGFRAYPVKHLSRMTWRGSRFEFEIEVLVRAAWAGLPLKQLPVGVDYAPPGRRVSHFHPWRDNLRISWTHAALVGRRLIPWPHRRLVRARPRFIEFLRHPLRFIASLLTEYSTPAGLAASAAVGIFLATLPLVSLHTLVILYVTTRLNLNRMMAVTIQNLCMPPLVPAACIELGHYMRHGRWLTEASMNTLVYELPDRILEWFLGSLILAPLGAAVAAAAVYALAQAIQHRRSRGHG